MSEMVDYLDVIRRAKLGDRENMGRLAEHAQGKVFVYIYRLTLNYDLSQDLTQETMLEMIRSLKRLKQTEKFWPWLFKTALGKVQHHFRNQGSRRIERKTIVDSNKLLEYAHKDKRGELSELIRKELSQVVLKAMGQIKLEYRNILTLRCFEQMPYSEIAFLVGCSELRAQLLFFRAKQSLKKQLSRNGFRREHFISALGLFGTITASFTKTASAATTLNAAVTKVGLTAALVGSVSTKFGAAITIATVTVAVTVGGGTIYKHINEPKTTLSYPTSLIRAIDPDGDGWKGALDNGGRGQLSSISANALIGERPDDKSTPLVIIPEGHLLEIGFAGIIVDGHGNDIVYIARTTGNFPHVFLTDGAEQEYELQTTPNIRRVGNYQVVGYDISGIELDFEPRALRLEGNGSRGPWSGAALFNVTARISR